jgi:hypothetical protein
MVFVAASSFTVLLYVPKRNNFTNLRLDPRDPLGHLYDVDDASTVITVGEWYHILAPAGTNQFFTSGIVP